RKTLQTAAMASGLVFLITCLTVTWWRPTAFHPGREVPVTLLRAPELFVPIVMAGFSAIALWVFARSQSRKALLAMFGILILDLVLYGQGIGWFTHSLGPQHELWQAPETVNLFRQREASRDAASYRILTQEVIFEPNVSVSTPLDTGNLLALQPDIYMMYSLENAGGYDGFGLSRYSRLVGNMTVWGQLSDAEATLRGDNRELDLLGVRYLLTRSRRAGVVETDIFPPATTTYRGEHFDGGDLSLGSIKSGRQLAFTVPATEIDHIALLTNL